MSRIGTGAREDHAPGYIGGPAPELAIDKIGDAAEQQADRRGRGDRIRHGEERNLFRPRIEEHREDHADQAAMEGHAALPDHEDLDRVGEIVTGFPKEDLAQTAAEDDS